MRAGMQVTDARQQAQGTTAGLRTRRQRGLGLGRHQQWVDMGSAAAGIRARRQRRLRARVIQVRGRAQGTELRAFWQLIIALKVAKNGLPRIIGTGLGPLAIGSVSSTTKSTR